MRTKQLGIFFMAMVFFFSGLTFSHAADDVIVLKAATTQPRRHPLHDNVYLHWGKEIEKRTHGKVKFEWYLANSLVNQMQAQKAVREGLVDVVVQDAIWVEESRYPIAKLMDLPFMFDSPSHGAYTFYKAYQAIPEMRKEFVKVKPLGFFTTDIQNICYKGAPPRTLEDMKGKKLWSASKMTVQMVKLLGATPVTTKIQDSYMALQRGMADGAFFPLAPAAAFKITEITNGYTVGSFSAGCQYFAMNLKKWNSLPPDVQKVFEDLTPSVGMLAGATLDNMTRKVLAGLKKRGDTIYVLSAEEKARWREKLKPLYDQAVADIDKKGLDGKAMLEKMMSLADEARKNPYPAADAWWQQKK